MATHLLKFCFFCTLLIAPGWSQAQKYMLPISPELSLKGDLLKVKIGTQWMGKIAPFRFGDYAVVESKVGWTVTKSKTNLFSTKVQSETENKFSFVLADTVDSVLVNAIYKLKVKELRSSELIPHIFIGDDELVLNSEVFSAFITDKDSLAEIWVLLMELVEGSEVNGQNRAFLSCGDRIISINHISSETTGKKLLALPAMGYEFVENKQSLCAVQYFGGGALGYNKNTIWLKTDLDAHMKLILSAAMTAIMQYKAP